MSSSLATNTLLAVNVGLAVGAGAGVLFLLLVLWLVFGPGPRRGRGFRRAERLLEQGNWEQALSTARGLQGQGPLSPAWREKLRALEGNCLTAAGDQALEEKRFEEGLRHYQDSASLTGTNLTPLRERVVSAMLAETRLRFSTPSDTNPVVRQLAERTLIVLPGCPEAHFWQGLAFARAGQVEQALTALDAAHQSGGKQYIDPPFYAGILLYRMGRAAEALRILADANRVDAGCPFVIWQMGLAMVAASNDPGMALRVLQRALGPKGLPLWKETPRRARVEAFPQGRSFVRRLAEQHPFTCPLLGDDIAALVRQAEQSMAQAHYRLGGFEASADLFTKLLQEVPPTLPLVRGLGLALARLGRYDQAFRHLRAASEMDPQDVHAAGYLALCAARGKPTQEDDKPKNVAWALRQLAHFDVENDPEFAALMSGVHAEARALDMAIGLEDQLRLCDLLASGRACDPEAAAAYEHLAREFPEALRDVYAWLYCRAARQHGVRGPRDRDLFARTFRTRDGAASFYAGRGWDLEEVEFTYLERCAETEPGRFPEVLGDDYPPRGESLLLERSRQLAKQDKADAALHAVTVLLKLAPRSTAAHDRAAALHYRRGDSEQTLSILRSWESLDPSDPLPAVRRAVIEQQRGDWPASRAALGHALELANGPARATVAFLAARLALASRGRKDEAAPAHAGNGVAEKAEPDSALAEAKGFLEDCLNEQPAHLAALWMLAAVHCARGDDEGLAALAPSLERPEVKEPRFHYMAAVCHLAAGALPQAVEAARRAAADPVLAAEGHYVLARALLGQGDGAAAANALEQAAVSGGPSAEHARALLGRVRFDGGDFAGAARWWTALDPGRRSAWKFDEPLRQTVFLAGLQALQEGRFEQAAETFREAGTLGLRERRLGQLIALAYFQAGQRLLYEASESP